MKPYSSNLITPVRRKTREVRVGDVRIGGSHPVVVQSMTTTATQDTEGTVAQIKKLIDVGCEIVRLTTPAMADVENLPNIRNEMKRQGLSVPLVADVHFLPQIALKACEYVEKVRINPGNFADRKRFAVMEYSDQAYAEELSRIADAFLPIVRRAKELGVSLRIGTNHGSLSDRIMNRFGDNPKGMVESAMEFVQIAASEGFHDLVLSMKASNVRVMIQAYRLLVSRMNELGMDYPLHLGVTEAGDGEDGRIKSAMGIASLLWDGLGDTIRVSLTEDPDREIPVAKRLVQLFARGLDANISKNKFSATWNFYEYERRKSDELSISNARIGANEVVKVWSSVPSDQLTSFAFVQRTLEPAVEVTILENSQRTLGSGVVETTSKTFPVVLRLNQVTPSDLSKQMGSIHALSVTPSGAWGATEYAEKLSGLLGSRPVWFTVRNDQELDQTVSLLTALRGKLRCGVEVEGTSLISIGRKVAARLANEKFTIPIHLRFTSSGDISESDITLKAATEIGALLCDGIGDSVEIATEHPLEFRQRLAFNILQASRVRMSKTEFIACPSCGRTLFDLQETTARIRSKTGHLKGVKIAIMGCIVNGPGEMADADFGYVGSGPGMINLYVGKDCVKRHIPFKEADQRLIDLIKEHGRWVEPPNPSTGQA